MGLTVLNINNHEHSIQKPLIFFLPGSGEGEQVHWDAVRDDVRLIGFFYPDWTELIKPETSFPGLVPYLKRKIQNELPDGPVHLVGYSIGGPLAYGCALALQSEGRTVDFLAILDSVPPDAPLRKTWRKRLKSLATFQVREGLASVLAKLLASRRGKPILQRLSRFRNVKLPFKFAEYLHPKLKIQLMIQGFLPWWQSAARQSAKFTTPTLLFRSEEHEAGEPEELGWNKYCLNMKVTHVAGSHASVMAPSALSSLCEELGRIRRDRSADPGDADNEPIQQLLMNA
jgi:thioesterase domain-containing protein